MTKSVRTIVAAGFCAGVLDIIAAFVLLGLRGIAPSRVLQAIASGVLGARAYQGGIATVALGGTLHFTIALTAAALFYLASGRIRLLTQHSVLSGLLYGVLVYAFMNLIVLPLSALVPRPSLLLVDVIVGATTL